MMVKTIDFLKTKKLKNEIIVNDGLNDKTWHVINDIMKIKYPSENILGLTYNKNGGKGWAVTSGLKYTRGKHILMVDADGATPIEDYLKLKDQMDLIESEQEASNNQRGALIIGSRKIVEDETNKV